MRLTNNRAYGYTAKLIITDVAIRQDSQNRYCLNDLHKGAGNKSASH